MSVFDTKFSRYLHGGKTETSKNKLGWHERVIIPHDASDIVYVMEKKYEGRPDLLASVMFNDPSLAWVILQFNRILDPAVELREGTVLRIPTVDRLKSKILTKKFEPNVISS